ncbi:MAG: preprotein translocase subunit SecG [Alphaproteobacteria bacterium]|nr:preprotein translocase subunit SecG [Alphaproteobacteria bacterium]
MFHVLLVIQVLVTLALVAIILIQRSESDGLGGLGGGGGGNAFMTGRGAANLMTKTTAILATVFMLLSLTLAIISSKQGTASRTSIVDQIESSEPSVPDADAPLPAVTPAVVAPAVVAPEAAPTAEETAPAATTEEPVAEQTAPATEGADATSAPATVPNP